MPKWSQIILFTLISTLSADAALAHGASVAYRRTEAIQIRATYESGEPMADAAVTVYSPEDPATPWLRGKTDDNGEFAFVPEAGVEGNWDVKVRQTGHGDIVSIPTEDATATDAWVANRYTPLQKAMMGALGIWGCVGTALYFSRRKGD